MFSIEFYKDNDGKEPIVEFLQELNLKALTSKEQRIRLKKIAEYFEVLTRFGTCIGEPYVKYIRDGIWELRPANDRILFAFWKNQTYIMLHHFVKKTQKTPVREIEQAKKNYSSFIDRSENDE